MAFIVHLLKLIHSSLPLVVYYFQRMHSKPLIILYLTAKMVAVVCKSTMLLHILKVVLVQIVLDSDTIIY